MSHDNSATELRLKVDHARVEAESDEAIIDASVLVRNRAEEITNVAAANLSFELRTAEGDKLSDLKPQGGTQLQQIDSGEEARWHGRCMGKVSNIQRDQSYQLRVDGFGKTCTTRFEFT